MPDNRPDDSAFVRAGAMRGGIGQQPPSIRPSDMVRYSLNTVFSVRNGANKRPGSRFVFALGNGYDETYNVRADSLVIGTDEYVVIYGYKASGKEAVRIVRVSGTPAECTVTVSAAADTYITTNSAHETDDLRFVASSEGGWFINTTIASASTEQTGTVTAATIASPTQLTSTAHGLETGQRIVITASSGITPSLVGSHIVTKVDANNITIPVNVTASASPSATWNRGAPTGSTMPHKLTRNTATSFTLDVVSWTERQSGTSTTNPAPAVVRSGLMIRDVGYFQGRFFIAGGSRINFSIIGTDTDFYKTDASNIVDGDPVEPPSIGASQTATIDWVVPVRKSLFLFTVEGRQYEMAQSGDVFKNGAAIITPTTRLATTGARPATIDPAIYTTTKDERSAQLQEYYFDEVNLPSQALDVSAHVPDLMFLATPTSSGPIADIRSVKSSPETGSVLILRNDFNSPAYAGSDLFHYTAAWEGDRKVLSSWSRHSIGTTILYHDIAIIGSNAYLLRGYPLGANYELYIERMPIAPESSHRVT